MGKIKPTRVTTPRIVQPGEGGGRSWLWLLLLIALGAWSWQVFEFGRQRAGFDAGQYNQLESDLQQRIEELEEERDALRASAAKFERAGQIDRAAADGVQSEVKALQDERAELKREVAFLKSLVSDDEKALVLSDFSLTPRDERSYRFEVTLSKRKDDQDPVSGQVEIGISGQIDGEDRFLQMSELTEGKRTNFGIRFKSFQKLKADLKLPAGFEPVSVLVVVKPGGQAFQSFEQAFDWNVPDA
jgi:cell division protein FtsB